jgi:hypothetical protein
MAIFRSPRCRGERSSNAGALADGIPVRGNRKPRHLADDWDDAPTNRDRTWKRHRKTRWKEIGK